MDMQPRASGLASVVVIDDDAAVVGALGFALEIEGYAVRAFRSATVAFTAPGLDRADCLIIDQNLTDETGIDLLARLRARGDRAPAVIITSNPPRALVARAAALGAQLVEKPLLDDQLFACVRDLTHRAALVPASA